MTDMDAVLNSIRRSFSLLWDEYGFNLNELKPRDGYRDNGYEVCFENGICKLVFISEGGSLDEIYVRTKKSPYFGRGLKYLTRLFTNQEPQKYERRSANEAEYFDRIAEYVGQLLPDILNLVENPEKFKETVESFEAMKKSEPITVEMIRAERARLHSLGLDSSLGAAMENLQKRDKHE